MKFLKILAFPFSLLYGCIVFLRNKFYDWNFIKSEKFALPIISVGNLSMGGTGKTPHIEYLIRLFKNEFTIATLSRGYGRKTSGFILSQNKSTTFEIGDEPLQFKTKFPELTVAVDEKRVRGIKKLLELQPTLQTILLDDAFQHRAVKPGLSIVLTDYNYIYLNDFVVPSGNLREFKTGIKRADIIIVTKCPEDLLEKERTRLLTKINPLKHQHIYFSYIKYGNLTPLNSDNTKRDTTEHYFNKSYTMILLTGIANTSALEDYLKSKSKNILAAKFPDHHVFTMNDIERVKEIFTTIASENKIIVTTEKDAMRLKGIEFKNVLNDLPFFYIPIEIDFKDTDKEEFNKKLINYVRTN